MRSSRSCPGAAGTRVSTGREAAGRQGGEDRRTSQPSFTREEDGVPNAPGEQVRVLSALSREGTECGSTCGSESPVGAARGTQHPRVPASGRSSHSRCRVPAGEQRERGEGRAPAGGEHDPPGREPPAPQGGHGHQEPRPRRHHQEERWVPPAPPPRNPRAGGRRGGDCGAGPGAVVAWAPAQLLSTGRCWQSWLPPGTRAHPLPEGGRGAQAGQCTPGPWQGRSWKHTWSCPQPCTSHHPTKSLGREGCLEEAPVGVRG